MIKFKLNIFTLALSIIFVSLSKFHLSAQTSCDRLGISNGWMLHMNDEEVDQITEACASTYALYFRTDFAWSDVQWNGSDEWNWSNIDRVLQSALDHKLELIAIVDYFPPWATIESDTSYWFNFVYEAGLRYIPQGVVIWEMWNEPNLNSFLPNPNVEDYVNKILIPGSNAIRKAAMELNTSVTVITGGLAPAATDGTNISQLDFVTELYTNGAQDYFDALGQHPYCWPLDPSIPNDFNWFLKTEELYQVMQSNGDGNKPIWGTELGWPTHNTSQNGVSEITQAEYLIKAFTLWNSWPWTGPLIWYAYNDAGTDLSNPEDHFGLVDHQFNSKPSLDSFLIVTNECAGSEITQLDVFDLPSDIIIFPNPVKDVFTMEGFLQTCTIKIIDRNGTVFKKTTNTHKSIRITINDLPAGMYFILIEDEDRSQISLKKIFKE